jgi:hypothetical protein
LIEHVIFRHNLVFPWNQQQAARKVLAAVILLTGIPNLIAGTWAVVKGFPLKAPPALFLSGTLPTTDFLQILSSTVPRRVLPQNVDAHNIKVTGGVCYLM